MSKERIERVIDWEIEKNLRELSVAEAITLGRLRQEFEMWEPEAAPPAPANPMGVATSGNPVVPNVNQSPPPVVARSCNAAYHGADLSDGVEAMKEEAD